MINVSNLLLFYILQDRQYFIFYILKATGLRIFKIRIINNDYNTHSSEEKLLISVTLKGHEIVFK